MCSRMKWLLIVGFVAGALACGEDIEIKSEDCEALRACAADPACDPGPNFEVECADEE